MPRAIRGLQRAGVGSGGLFRIELHSAADGIAARQGALRAAQDLDAVEVEQVEDGAGQRGVVDIVHVDAHARFQCGVEVELADTAYGSAQRGAEGGSLWLQRDI